MWGGAPRLAPGEGLEERVRRRSGQSGSRTAWGSRLGLARRGGHTLKALNSKTLNRVSDASASGIFLSSPARSDARSDCPSPFSHTPPPPTFDVDGPTRLLCKSSLQFAVSLCWPCRAPSGPHLPRRRVPPGLLSTWGHGEKTAPVVPLRLLSWGI